MNCILQGQIKGANKELSNLSNYQKALRNIGGRPNRNLLDNWYFVGGGSQQGGGQLPINQQGAVSMDISSRTTSFLDRYFCTRAAGTTAGSLIMELIPSGLSVPVDGVFQQTMENADALNGHTVTLSALYGNNLIFATFVWDSAGFYTVLNTDDNGARLAYRGNLGYVQFYNYSGDTKIPAAWKLEGGPIQTLAYKDENGAWQLFETPDYEEELAKCQRYLQVIAAGKGGVYFPVGYGMAFSTTAVRIATYSPVTMRSIAPTVSFSGDFQLVHGATIFDVTDIKQDTLNSLNSISLNAQATGLTLGDLYQLRAGNDATAKIIISAEL